MPIAPRERLIVALDLSSVEAAEAMVARLGDAVSFYKIGYQLAFAGGLAYAQKLAGAGKRVFLDLKLHDIGNTVAQGVKSVARLGATFLTVHAYPQTMQAAVEAREGGLRILAVTVLTSYDDSDLKAAGYDASVKTLVAARAEQARDLGVDGLVCSPEEAANVRPIAGADMVLVTPGIRPAGAGAGDQKRIMTPAAAIAAGADYLVVGRPIVAAADPRAAAEAIVAEIAQATGEVKERDGQGLLDRARRCAQRGRLQALCRSQSRDLPQIWRPLRRARRQVRVLGRRKPAAQRRHRISRLRRGGRLLSLARIPGEHQGAAAAFRPST